jgi:hypothetical protein
MGILYHEQYQEKKIQNMYWGVLHTRFRVKTVINKVFRG